MRLPQAGQGSNDMTEPSEDDPIIRGSMTAHLGRGYSRSGERLVRVRRLERVIRIVGGSDGGPNFEASVGGIAIYLDNFAIKTLAKGDPALRGRFVAALND
jgi:hypothetical protein